jgi:NADH-quinone oxidoreductase subunit I
MIRYFKEIFSGAKSLLIGMKVTAHYGMKRPVTVHYPYEKLPITPNYHGHTDLVLDMETGTHRCITCMMCQKICPSYCIEVFAEKPEGAKKKELVGYGLDFTKCSLCGNCVEVCPTSALEFSNEYNLVGLSRHDFHFNLLERLKKKADALGIKPKPPEPKPEAKPAAPAGEAAPTAS